MNSNFDHFLTERSKTSVKPFGLIEIFWSYYLKTSVVHFFLGKSGQLLFLEMLEIKMSLISVRYNFHNEPFGKKEDSYIEDIY